MTDKTNIGFLEGIFNPERLRAEEYKTKLATKASQLSGEKQIGAMKWLEQNPGIAERGEWTNIPGYDKVQARFLEKQRLQNLNQPHTEEKAKKISKNEERIAKEKEESPMVMGATGFRVQTGRERWDSVANNILQKVADMESEGIENPYDRLAFKEKLVLQKVFNIKPNKKDAPTSGDEWEKTLKMSADGLLAMRIRNRVAQMRKEEEDIETIKKEVDLMKSMPVPFDEAKQGLTKMLEMRYPDMDRNKIPEKIEKWEFENKHRWIDELGISLPTEITTWQQAWDFMKKQGMDPDAAAQWLNDRRGE